MTSHPSWWHPLGLFGAELRRRWPTTSRRDLERRLARWNHVLVPGKKQERDRLRGRRAVRLLFVGVTLMQMLTREGRRLLLILVPVGLSSLDVRYSQVHLLFVLLVGLLWSSLLLRRWFVCDGLACRVHNAHRVAVNQPLNFQIDLVNRGSKPLYNLRIGSPFLPWDGRFERHARGVARLLPGERHSVVASARFLARGEHHLDAFEAAMLVPGGLATGPAQQTEGARFLVVPKLANVCSLAWDGGRGDSNGDVITRQAPGGAELIGVRPYRRGDELKHLHARTWARTGVPHVRKYHAESSEHVTLAVLTCDSDSERVKEAAISLAAGVAAHCTLCRGGVDLLLTDVDSNRIEPRTGQGALDAVLDKLAVLEPTTAPTVRVPIGAALQRSTHAVVVCVQATPEIHRAVSEARQSGVAVRLLAVHDEHARNTLPVPDERAPCATLIPVEAIESGGAIAL